MNTTLLMMCLRSQLCSANVCCFS